MVSSIELLQAALAHHQAGRLGEAEAMYRRILSAQPPHADRSARPEPSGALTPPQWLTVCFNLGSLLAAQGRAAEAVDCFRRAVALEPNLADAHFYLGSGLHALGDLDAARGAYRESLRLKPDFLEPRMNLGDLLQSQGQFHEALACYDQAIQYNGNYALAWLGRGNVHRVMRMFDAARADFEAAIRLAPEDPRAYNNLATMLQESSELSAALTLYRLALEREPRSAEILINIGSVLQVQGDMSAAADHHQRALAIDPRQRRAHFNLGVIDHFLGRDRDAIEHLDEAIRLREGYAEAYHHRATVRLSQGDFEAGWRDFEWRFRCSDYPHRRGAPLGDMPRWDGSPLAGRRLLMYAEQGLGDTLQFIRYARRLEQRGDEIVVEVPGVLVPLLAASGLRNLVAEGLPLPPCDVQVPLLSTPGLVGLPPEAIGVTIPYLAADPRRIDSWRGQLGDGNRFRIGIVWQGRTSYAFDRVRSIPLAAFAPLAQVEGVELFSLQKAAGSEQIAALGGRFTVNDLGSRLDSDGGAFMDTAAVMCKLDLIITSDTAAAHLAGGLGLNVWLALSTPAEWRWLYQRADSPWYPTMRLFRQPREGDWAGVFETMKRELTSLVRRR